jgi:Sulfotransferase domain
MIRRVLKHLSRVSDVFFRNLRIERDITVFPDDIFLTSYPRSGNTWTRFLVGNLVYQDEPVTFLNLERLVPDMYKSGDWVLRRRPRPRVLKSHECFDPRYRRVIYIVRDPRDVAVSNFHWEMKQRALGEAYPIEKFVPEWINCRCWPRIGSWGDHVTSWLSTRRGDQGFVLLRYEDLMRDTEFELAKIARLLGIEPTPERLRRAVELSSAERMRQLEIREGGKWVQTRYTRQDKRFVRNASSGDWKAVLPAESVTLIEATWGHLMQDLGYDLTTPPAQPLASSHIER